MPGKIVRMEDGLARALEAMARDQMKSFQEVADEAFCALLKKYDRPTNLKDALRRSAHVNGKRHALSFPKKKKGGKRKAA